LLLCPLCHAQKPALYARHKRAYHLCAECSLLFVSPDEYLDEEAEKKRYDLHTNSSGDPGYKNYLRKVSDPLCERLSKGSSGLDFGSGPGPTLSKILQEQGHEMRIYDYFYAKDEAVLKQKYDFITSTEVVEHLYDPHSVLDQLWGMLKAEGLLALLTQLYPARELFDEWYYKNDPTHVCFYSLPTMSWLASKWDAQLESVGKDLFIFKKRPEHVH
jgi:hypothetical protein